MHSDTPSTSSTGPADINADSLKAKRQAWSEQCLHDPTFFLPLNSKEQIVVLDAMIRNCVSLTLDQRKAFLQCSAKFLQSVSSESFITHSDKVLQVVRYFAHHSLMSLAEIRTVLYPLRRCLEHYLTNRHAITALHAVFMQLCVALDMFDVALPLICTPFYDIDVTFLPTSLEYLSFHYFSALVFAAFKQFDKALASFDLAIGAVSVQISAIQIAAYKKRVLIDIILNGSEMSPLPKLISPIVSKNLEVSSSPYHQMESVAAAGSQALEAFFVQHHRQLLADGNIGLAKQALMALRKKQIARLAQSYMTLSFLDIARMIGITNVDSIEAIVVSMVDEGSINATIDQARQMLTFYDDSESFTNRESPAKLFKQLQDISAAHDRILAKNRLLATDGQFLRKSIEANVKAEAGMYTNEDAISHLTDMQQLFG